MSEKTKKRINRLSFWQNVITALILADSVFLFFVIEQHWKNSTVIPLVKQEVAPVFISPYIFLKLEAKSAAVFDGKQNRFLYEYNSRKQLPLASLTKIMTAITALSLVSASTTIPFDSSFIGHEEVSGINAKETFSLHDLLKLMLVRSSNDSAFAIASVVGSLTENTNDLAVGRKRFVSEMNKIAKKIGVRETYFVNSTGLDENGDIAGSYGSAQDIVKLMDFAVQNFGEIFKSTTEERIDIYSSSTVHHVVNSNKSIRNLPGLVGSKTGYTDLAGGNLAITYMFATDTPITVVVLGSSKNGRFTDIEMLASTPKAYFMAENEAILKQRLSALSDATLQ